MERDVENRLMEIEKRYTDLKRLFAGFFIIFLAGLASLGSTRINKFDIIRAKGIIIEDKW